MMAADTSALMAVLLDEPEGSEFHRLMRSDGEVLVSTANAVELLIVAIGRGELIVRAAADLLNQPFIRLVPVDEEQLWAAAEAHRDFGKGRHPAGLNYGDTFAYALASVRSLPLLYKGEDFGRTGIASVVASI